MNKKQKECIDQWFLDENGKSRGRFIEINKYDMTDFAQEYSKIDPTPDPELWAIKRNNGSIKVEKLSFEQAVNYLYGLAMNAISSKVEELITYNKGNSVTVELQNGNQVIYEIVNQTDIINSRRQKKS